MWNGGRVPVEETATAGGASCGDGAHLAAVVLPGRGSRPKSAGHPGHQPSGSRSAVVVTIWIGGHDSVLVGTVEMGVKAERR